MITSIPIYFTEETVIMKKKVPYLQILISQMNIWYKYIIQKYLVTEKILQLAIIFTPERSNHQKHSLTYSDPIVECELFKLFMKGYSHRSKNDIDFVKVIF